MTSHDAIIQTMSHLPASFQKQLQKYCFFCTYTNICAKKCYFLLFYSLFIDLKWERTNQFAIHKEISIIDSRLKNLLYQPV